MNSIKNLIIAIIATISGFISWAQSDTIKIMPLGNSITKGSGTCMEPDSYLNCVGYRRLLYHMLENDGLNINFVGSQGGDYQNLPEPKDYDNNHEGHGGRTAWWLNTRLNGPDEYFLPDYDPDVILYHIGTNNLHVGNIHLYAEAVEESMDIIWDYDSTITVVIAKIILSMNEALRNARTHNYNILLEELVQTKMDSGYSVYLVDMETALDYETDMVDQLHPNEQGYEKMALVWYDILAEILPPYALKAPTITTEPDTLIAEGSLFEYNVNVLGYPRPVFHLLDSPDGMMIDTITGHIEWFALLHGSYDVTVEARNSEGTHIQNFTLGVNKYPYCTDGLVSYWKLEESTPPFMDSFGNNHGDCTSCPDATAGQAGFAQYFNGIDSENAIIIPNTDNFGSELTLMAWIYPDSLDVTDRGIISKKYGFVFEVESNGNKLSFSVFSGTFFEEYEPNTPLNVIPEGAWSHVSATFKNGVASIFINGELIDSKLLAYTALGSSLEPYYIGRTLQTQQWGTNRYFDGKIDEVAIFERALSESEIYDHYLAGLNGHNYCGYHVLFTTRVLLEGPFNNGEISNYLNATDFLPFSQPYNAAPWVYNGDELIGGLCENIADWVLVELRSDSATTLVQRSAFIDKDGYLVDLDGRSEVRIDGIPPGDYYLVIHHRNHLSVMSANLVYFDNTGSSTYDFTTGIEQYYQNSGAVQLSDGSWAMISGNTDGSSQVDQTDKDFWMPQAGLKGYSPADFNFDAEVDNRDKNDFLVPSMGSESSVPE